MQHPKSRAAALIRMTLTAALLAVPCLALAQAPATSQQSPIRPINPATDPTAPAEIAPAPPSPASIAGAAATLPPASQIIGSRLHNDRDQNIGEVEDVLLTAGGPMALVQVGGFLGLGRRIVALPLAEIHWDAGREWLVLPGASKEALAMRPEFNAAALQRR